MSSSDRTPSNAGSSPSADDEVDDSFEHERVAQETDTEDSPQRTVSVSQSESGNSVFDTLQYGDADSFLFDPIEYQEQQENESGTDFFASVVSPLRPPRPGGASPSSAAPLGPSPPQQSRGSRSALTEDTEVDTSTETNAIALRNIKLNRDPDTSLNVSNESDEVALRNIILSRNQSHSTEDHFSSVTPPSYASEQQLQSLHVHPSMEDEDSGDNSGTGSEDEKLSATSFEKDAKRQKTESPSNIPSKQEQKLSSPRPSDDDERQVTTSVERIGMDTTEEINVEASESDAIPVVLSPAGSQQQSQDLLAKSSHKTDMSQPNPLTTTDDMVLENTSRTKQSEDLSVTVVASNKREVLLRENEPIPAVDINTEEDSEPLSHTELASRPQHSNDEIDAVQDESKSTSSSRSGGDSDSSTGSKSRVSFVDDDENDSRSSVSQSSQRRGLDPPAEGIQSPTSNSSVDTNTKSPGYSSKTKELRKRMEEATRSVPAPPSDDSSTEQPRRPMDDSSSRRRSPEPSLSHSSGQFRDLSARISEGNASIPEESSESEDEDANSNNNTRIDDNAEDGNTGAGNAAVIEGDIANDDDSDSGSSFEEDMSSGGESTEAINDDSDHDADYRSNVSNAVDESFYSGHASTDFEEYEDSVVTETPYFSPTKDLMGPGNAESQISSVDGSFELRKLLGADAEGYSEARVFEDNEDSGEDGDNDTETGTDLQYSMTSNRSVTSFGTFGTFGNTSLAYSLDTSDPIVRVQDHDLQGDRGVEKRGTSQREKRSGVRSNETQLSKPNTGLQETTQQSSTSEKESAEMGARGQVREPNASIRSREQYLLSPGSQGVSSSSHKNSSSSGSKSHSEKSYSERLAEMLRPFDTDAEQSSLMRNTNSFDQTEHTDMMSMGHTEVSDIRSCSAVDLESTLSRSTPEDSTMSRSTRENSSASRSTPEDSTMSRSTRGGSSMSKSTRGDSSMSKSVLQESIISKSTREDSTYTPEDSMMSRSTPEETDIGSHAAIEPEDSTMSQSTPSGSIMTRSTDLRGSERLDSTLHSMLATEGDLAGDDDSTYYSSDDERSSDSDEESDTAESSFLRSIVGSKEKKNGSSDNDNNDFGKEDASNRESSNDVTERSDNRRISAHIHDLSSARTNPSILSDTIHDDSQVAQKMTEKPDVSESMSSGLSNSLSTTEGIDVEGTARNILLEAIGARGEDDESKDLESEATTSLSTKKSKAAGDDASVGLVSYTSNYSVDDEDIGDITKRIMLQAIGMESRSVLDGNIQKGQGLGDDRIELTEKSNVQQERSVVSEDGDISDEITNASDEFGIDSVSEQSSMASVDVGDLARNILLKALEEPSSNDASPDSNENKEPTSRVNPTDDENEGSVSTTTASIMSDNIAAVAQNIVNAAMISTGRVLFGAENTPSALLDNNLEQDADNIHDDNDATDSNFTTTVSGENESVGEIARKLVSAAIEKSSSTHKSSGLELQPEGGNMGPVEDSNYFVHTSDESSVDEEQLTVNLGDESENMRNTSRIVPSSIRSSLDESRGIEGHSIGFSTDNEGHSVMNSTESTRATPRIVVRNTLSGKGENEAPVRLGDDKTTTESETFYPKEIQQTKMRDEDDMSLSSGELQELDHLLDSHEVGKKTNEDRLYELDLYDRWQNGENLNDEEQKNLDDFKTRRRNVRKFKIELKNMKKSAAVGEDVDPVRMNQLELLVRDSRREGLTDKEAEDLAKFIKTEKIPDNWRGAPSIPDNSAKLSEKTAEKQNFEDPQREEKGDSEGAITKPQEVISVDEGTLAAQLEREQDPKIEDDYSSLSTWELEELDGLIEQQEEGFNVSKKRLRDLELFDRWQSNEALDEDELKDLEVFKKKRKRDRAYGRELISLIEARNRGASIDRDRLAALELYARHHTGEELSKEELEILKEFEHNENKEVLTSPMKEPGSDDKSTKSTDDSKYRSDESSHKEASSSMSTSLLKPATSDEEEASSSLSRGRSDSPPSETETSFLSKPSASDIEEPSTSSFYRDNSAHSLGSLFRPATSDEDPDEDSDDDSSSDSSNGDDTEIDDPKLNISETAHQEASSSIPPQVDESTPKRSNSTSRHNLNPLQRSLFDSSDSKEDEPKNEEHFVLAELKHSDVVDSNQGQEGSLEEISITSASYTEEMSDALHALSAESTDIKEKGSKETTKIVDLKDLTDAGSGTTEKTGSPGSKSKKSVTFEDDGSSHYDSCKSQTNSDDSLSGRKGSSNDRLVDFRSSPNIEDHGDADENSRSKDKVVTTNASDDEESSYNSCQSQEEDLRSQRSKDDTSGRLLGTPRPERSKYEQVSLLPNTLSSSNEKSSSSRGGSLSSRELLLSTEEMNELNHLLDKEDRGESVDQDRIRELDLLCRWQIGEKLGDEELVDLYKFKAKRKKHSRLSRVSSDEISSDEEEQPETRSRRKSMTLQESSSMKNTPETEKEERDRSEMANLPTIEKTKHPGVGDQNKLRAKEESMNEIERKKIIDERNRLEERNRMLAEEEKLSSLAKQKKIEEEIRMAKETQIIKDLESKKSQEEQRRQQEVTRLREEQIQTEKELLLKEERMKIEAERKQLARDARLAEERIIAKQKLRKKLEHEAKLAEEMRISQERMRKKLEEEERYLREANNSAQIQRATEDAKRRMSQLESMKQILSAEVVSNDPEPPSLEESSNSSLSEGISLTRESQLSVGEMDELEELLNREENGESVNEDRIYELDLFSRYQVGDKLDQDEIADLNDFRKRRRKHRLGKTSQMVSADYDASPSSSPQYDQEIMNDSYSRSSTLTSETQETPPAAEVLKRHRPPKPPSTTRTEDIAPGGNGKSKAHKSSRLERKNDHSSSSSSSRSQKRHQEKTKRTKPSDTRERYLSRSGSSSKSSASSSTSAESREHSRKLEGSRNTSKKEDKNSPGRVPVKEKRREGTHLSDEASESNSTLSTSKSMRKEQLEQFANASVVSSKSSNKSEELDSEGRVPVTITSISSRSSSGHQNSNSPQTSSRSSSQSNRFKRESKSKTSSTSRPNDKKKASRPHKELSHSQEIAPSAFTQKSYRPESAQRKTNSKEVEKVYHALKAWDSLDETSPKNREPTEEIFAPKETEKGTSSWVPYANWSPFGYIKQHRPELQFESYRPDPPMEASYRKEEEKREVFDFGESVHSDGSIDDSSRSSNWGPPSRRKKEGYRKIDYTYPTDHYDMHSEPSSREEHDQNSTKKENTQESYNSVEQIPVIVQTMRQLNELPMRTSGMQSDTKGFTGFDPALLMSSWGLRALEKETVKGPPSMPQNIHIPSTTSQSMGSISEEKQLRNASLTTSYTASLTDDRRIPNQSTSLTEESRVLSAKDTLHDASSAASSRSGSRILSLNESYSEYSVSSHGVSLVEEQRMQAEAKSDESSSKLITVESSIGESADSMSNYDLEQGAPMPKDSRSPSVMSQSTSRDESNSRDSVSSFLFTIQSGQHADDQSEDISLADSVIDESERRKSRRSIISFIILGVVVLALIAGALTTLFVFLEKDDPTPSAPTLPPSPSSVTQPTPAPSPEPTTKPPTNMPTEPLPVTQPTPIPTRLPTPQPTPSPTSGNGDDTIIINDNALFNLIVENSPDGGASLKDSSSPQSAALNWLQNPMNENYSDSRLLQRYALATLYYATNPNNNSWKSTSSWLSDSNECDWFSTSESPSNVCTTTSNGGDVYQELDLRDNGLSGSIPKEISLLTALKTIRFGDNDLVGSIPSNIAALPRLEYIDLSSNQLGDLSEIDTLQNMQSLIHLDISDNFFKTTIPVDTWSEGSPLSSTLKVLDFGSNQFFGTLPTEIGFLTKLTGLSVYDNDLSGQLPASISKLPLELLYIDSNKFTSNTLFPGVPQAICSLRPDPLREFWADCQEIDCPCCTTCCTEGQGCISV